MENKANYVAVGAFVLACVIGLVVTILWLAGSQYSQEYAYYQTYFEGAVTGLGKGTVTRYNGIDVGKIQDLRFDPNDPQRVIVTLEVQPGLNIREDSTATIDARGSPGGLFGESTAGPPRPRSWSPSRARNIPSSAPNNPVWRSWNRAPPKWWPSSMSRPPGSTICSTTI